MLNNLMQGEFKRSASDLGRFLINSTLGVAGLWDHASKMGLEKHDEDFGQTLAVWGVDSGPYLMLPILGPSTVRDFGADLSGFVIGEVSEQDGDHWDWNSNPLKRIDHIPTRNQLLLMELVDKRAGLLEFEDQLSNAADEYAFVRDVYLQNRKFKVYNGDMPLEDEFECEDEMSEDCDF
jgi:phospholipid-binding lipoprotein MlaA